MGLNTWQRKEIIKQRLMTEGRVAVSELSRKLSVSAVTIRHDLAELSREGFLVRTYGGAIRKEGAISPEYSFLAKSRQHSQEKKMIAAAAARLIQPGQIIFLDTGTTTLEIARQLATVNFDLTVVTTSLPVVSTLIANSAIRLLVIGGFVRRPLADLSGPGTVSQLAQMSFQQC
ncbi:MAG TPA: DeoR/GlpR family DNA-binding transcription regulator, partial [bacterium]|nr:DeoR/GlpR family DNA-binding transcription regulator [bacterium]